MKNVVVGSGYVGLVAGVCFAELGHEVVLVDNDASKVKSLRDGQVPIHEEFLEQLLKQHTSSGKIQFSDSLANSLDAAAVVFIAVGTPAREDGDADLSYVEDVVRTIAQNIKDYVVVVEKSTVPVLTHDWIRKVMLLNGAKEGTFDVVSNPEFLREGTAVHDFLFPDRIVVGADTERAAQVVSALYRPLTDGSYHKAASIPARPGSTTPSKLLITNAKSAELIKHASNAFLATKISFINAVANICESVGADVREVCDGMGADTRIGRNFLNPGVGYGGSCFPKDLKAFHSVARDCGYDFSLLEDVIKINEQQRARFLRKVRQALWNLKSKKIAVLGLAFKGGTDDIRESPAIAVVRSLTEEGANLTVFDPAAMTRAKAELGDSVQYAESAYAACEGAEAVLILTEWDEFGKLDLARLKSTLRYPIIVDGRNMYSLDEMRRAGLQYYSVGRPAVAIGEKATTLK